MRAPLEQLSKDPAVSAIAATAAVASDDAADAADAAAVGDSSAHVNGKGGEGRGRAPAPSKAALSEATLGPVAAARVHKRLMELASPLLPGLMEMAGLRTALRFTPWLLHCVERAGDGHRWQPFPALRLAISLSHLHRVACSFAVACTRCHACAVTTRSRMHRCTHHVCRRC